MGHEKFSSIIKREKWPIEMALDRACQRVDTLEDALSECRDYRGELVHDLIVLRNRFHRTVSLRDEWIGKLADAAVKAGYCPECAADIGPLVDWLCAALGDDNGEA